LYARVDLAGAAPPAWFHRPRKSSRGSPASGR